MVGTLSSFRGRFLPSAGGIRLHYLHRGIYVVYRQAKNFLGVRRWIGCANSALLLTLLNIAPPLVSEAHDCKVTRSMLEKQCVFANQVSLLIQRVIFT